MDNFKQTDGKDVKVNFQQRFVPSVFVERKALNQMHLFVDECADEIGWLGTATFDESNNSYTVHDVFLFDQQVHSTTTEITPAGLSSFAEELLQQPDGVETWNNMKVWGHSHVRMATGPSGQDDKQMDEFSNIGHDWFIRIIANKLGSFRVDLFNYKLGVTYLNMAWEVLATGEELAVEDQVAELFRKITELEAQIAEGNKQELEAQRAEVKAEMAQKVRKIVSTYTKPTSVGTKPYSYPGKKTYTKPGAIGYNTAADDWDDVYGYNHSGFELDDMIDVADSVMEYFTVDEIAIIAKMGTTHQLEQYLSSQGYGNYFSLSDKTAILRFAPGLLTKYKGA